MEKKKQEPQSLNDTKSQDCAGATESQGLTILCDWI